MLLRGDKLLIGKELLKPVVEIMEYETASGKLFTEGKDLKTPEVKLSFSLDKLSMVDFIPDDALAKEQDRARQNLEYQQDRAAIEALRQEPISCKSFKEGVDKILETFKKRKLNCTHIFIPRILLVDIIKKCSDIIDPVTKRELIMAGHIGSLQNTETMFIMTAGTNTFEITDENELVGVNSTKCKREYISKLTCIKEGEHIKFEGSIKFDVDPEGVVWVNIDKK